MQSESSFKDRVMKDLRMIPGVWVLKTQERAHRGIPDLLICAQGEMVAIELKRDGESPDPLQEEILKKIQAAGGSAFWTSPKFWPFHLEQFIRRYRVET